VQGEDITIAQGVDEEPVESNRRIFDGWRYQVMYWVAAIYAFFHLAALNGLSIRAMTGGAVVLPFLPNLPMETWTYRIVHIAGALLLGFIFYAAAPFVEDRRDRARPTTWIGLALLVPAIFAFGVAITFALEIRGGAMWNGLDAGIRFREIWLYGVPLLVATVGGIALGWFDRSERGDTSVADLVLSVCGFAVAAYFITIYSTLMRNSTGTPFAPIGISLAAIAGTLLIMELTRRVAGVD
jgi:hypothetical protein